jgi:hypothetical protein
MGVSTLLPSHRASVFFIPVPLSDSVCLLCCNDEALACLGAVVLDQLSNSVTDLLAFVRLDSLVTVNTGLVIDTI